jgi:hypothetical protein
MSHQLTVFIDEAGDPGTRDGIAYYDTRHEWLCISAVVTRSARADDVIQWVKDLRAVANSRQAGALHYHRITNERRPGVCSELARKPVRAVTVASHKSNMREYVNPRLGAKVASDRFYNWAVRLLLERVTGWAEDWLIKEHGALTPMRIIFATRGGHDYEHMFKYIDKLRMQRETGTLFLKGKGLHPTLLNQEHWETKSTDEAAGLQLADCVASAFAQGVNVLSPVYWTEPAKALAPIMVTDRHGVVADTGLMLLPFRHHGKIPNESWPLFEFYGFKK